MKRNLEVKEFRSLKYKINAPNGIVFFCDSPLCELNEGPPAIQSPTNLTSAVGEWGSWGSVLTCPNYGYFVGF